MTINDFNKSVFDLKKEKLNSQPLEKPELKIKFKVICKQSYNRKDLYFTNKLKSKFLTNVLSSQVYDILNIDGKEYDLDKSPIDDIGKFDFLERNRNDEERISLILQLYGEKFEDNTILKCYPCSELGHKIGGKGLKGDKVRVFIKKDDDDNWVVVLIDPNHLVATELYKTEYNKYKNNQFDFNQLKLSVD